MRAFFPPPVPGGRRCQPFPDWLKGFTNTTCKRGKNLDRGFLRQAPSRRIRTGKLRSLALSEAYLKSAGLRLCFLRRV